MGALTLYTFLKFLDDRFANPAYALLLVTGISMVIVGDLSLGTFWLATALALYGLLVVVALAAIVIAIVFLMVTKPTF